MPEKKEIKSHWISVKESLPPKNQVVSTKIASEGMGDWCLIDRIYDGVWRVANERHNDFNDPKYPPTHWHE